MDPDQLLNLCPAGARLWQAQQKMMVDTPRSFDTGRDLFVNKTMWAPLQKELFFQMYQRGLFNLTILSAGSGAAHNEVVIDRLITETKSSGSIQCTDREPCPDACLPVEKIEAVKAVEKYPSQVLYLSWPTYTGTWAEKALRVFKGEWLVYIGEEEGGCCANDEFFRVLEEEWEDEAFVDKQHNWYGLHCYPHIYRRKAIRGK